LTARMFVRVIEVLAGYSLTFLLPMSALISSTLIALVISQLSALWPAWQAAGRGIMPRAAGSSRRSKTIASKLTP